MNWWCFRTFDTFLADLDPVVEWGMKIVSRVNPKN